MCEFQNGVLVMTTPRSFFSETRVEVMLSRVQSHTQTPQALWSAGGRQERVRGTGVLLSQDFCAKTMLAVTQPLWDSQSKNFSKISVIQSLSWRSSADQKRPEDSGYEIVEGVVKTNRGLFPSYS